MNNPTHKRNILLGIAGFLLTVGFFQGSNQLGVTVCWFLGFCFLIASAILHFYRLKYCEKHNLIPKFKDPNWNISLQKMETYFAKEKKKGTIFLTIGITLVVVFIILDIINIITGNYSLFSFITFLFSSADNFFYYFGNVVGYCIILILGIVSLCIGYSKTLKVKIALTIINKNNN